MPDWQGIDVIDTVQRSAEAADRPRYFFEAIGGFLPMIEKETEGPCGPLGFTLRA